MKNALLFMVMMPLLVMFNSCIGEKMIDVEKENKNGKTKLIKTFTLSSFDDYDKRYHESDRSEYFYDDKQRLTRVEKYNSEYGVEKCSEQIFTYEYNRIIIDVTEEEGYHPISRGIFTLDNNNYVTRIDNYDGFTNRGWHTILEYSNGYLSKASYNRSDNNPPSSVNTYIWEKGNLVKINYADGSTASFSYGNVENKLNVNFPWFFEEELPYFRFFYSRNNMSYMINLTCSLKFKGVMTSKNLPIRIIYLEYGETITQNYSYTLDPDGYPIEIILKHSEDGKYGYYEETMKYIITYY